MPAQWLWCIINNLHKFNDKANYILELITNLKQIKDHRLLSTFTGIFEKIEEYYTENKKFSL